MIDYMPLVQIHTLCNPHIEAQIIREEMKTTRPNILLVDSTGDILLHLLSEPNIGSVECVDPSNSQISLMELKQSLWYHTTDPNIRERFMNGELSKPYLDWYFSGLSLQSRSYWLKHYDLLEIGLSNKDLYSNILQSNPNNKDLQLLGQDFMKNKLNINFVNYLQTKQQQSLSHYHVYRNILFQLHCNKSNEYKTKFIQADIKDHLDQSRRLYDFVSLSNILDNYSKPDIDRLFKVLHSRMNLHSRLLIRQIYSDVDIQPLFEKYFVILDYNRPYLKTENPLFNKILLGCPKKNY